MDSQPTALSSPAATSSMSSTDISRLTGPTKGQLRAFWLAMHLTLSILLYYAIAIVKKELLPTRGTLIAIILIQPLLILFSKSPAISAAIYRRAFQRRVRVVRYGTGKPKYYTLPECFNIFASSPNIDDPSMRFGMFEVFVQAVTGPVVGWVGFASAKDFSSRGFFSRLIRGGEDLVGRKVYEVYVNQQMKEDHVRAVASTGIDVGSVVGEVRVTGRLVGEVLGVCEVGGRVAVLMEEWFVKSDGWKMGEWRET